MSTHAYREITPPVVAAGPTFNVPSCNQLMDTLVAHDESEENQSDSRIELRVETLDTFLQDLTGDEYPAEAITELKNDVVAAQITGQDYITYHIF